MPAVLPYQGILRLVLCQAQHMDAIYGFKNTWSLSHLTASRRWKAFCSLRQRLTIPHLKHFLLSLTPLLSCTLVCVLGILP